MRQTYIAVDVSIQSSIVRSDQSILLSIVTLEGNLCCEDSNHWLLSRSLSTLLWHNNALQTLEHALNLIRILNIKLYAQDAVLNLIDALAFLILLSCDLSLRSTSQNVRFVSVNNLNIIEVLNDNVRRIQVIVCPEIHHAGVLSAVIAAILMIGASTSLHQSIVRNLIIKCLAAILITASFLLVISGLSQSVLESLEIVEACSLNSPIVCIGNEYQATQTLLNENVKNVDAIESLVDLIRHLLHLTLNISTSTCVVADQSAELLELALNAGKSLLESWVDFLEVVNKCLDSSDLRLQVTISSLTSCFLIAKTSLQISNTCQSLTEVSLNRLHLSIEISNGLFVSLAFKLTTDDTVEGSQSSLSISQTGFESSDQTFKTLNLILAGCLFIRDLAIQLVNCILQLSLGCMSSSFVLQSCNLTLSVSKLSRKGVNLVSQICLSLLKSGLVSLNQRLKVIDFVIIVLTRRNRTCSSKSKCY